MVGHPPEEELTAFSAGRLGEEALTRIEGHLTDCADCRDRLKSLPPDRLTVLLREPSREVNRPPDEGGLNADVPVGLERHPRYRILGKLGSGGMGIVYLAEHRLMKRVVALKVIAPHLTASRAAVTRFRREMEAVGKLAHANIAAAYDADETDGQLILVEEYIEGNDLASLVREKGPLPLAEACGYVLQAARALQHAHERGILHRDIKPHNLTVTGEGHVKVLDFGLALLREQKDEADTDSAIIGVTALPNATLTDFGRGMGTADFASPEQVRDAHAADARSDIYSLGRTLVFLLTGRVERSGASPGPDVPLALVGVLDRMTAPAPDQRPRTMTEVADALTPFVVGEGRPRGRRLLLGGLILLLVVLPIVVGGIWGGARRNDRTPAEEKVGEVRRFEGHQDVVRGVCFCPDGNHVLSASYDTTLRLWNVKTGEEVRRFEGQGDRVIGVAVSRDDKQALSAGVDGTVRLWDVDSGKEVRCLRTGCARNFGVAFSPDGRQALTCGNDSLIRRWDLDGGKELLVYRGHTDWVHSVQFSGDGAVIVSSSRDCTVRVWDAASGAEVGRFDRHAESVLSAAFAPDGKHILSGGNGSTLYLWDRETGKVRQTMRGHFFRSACVTFSPDGRRALTTGGHADVPGEDCTVRLWDLESGKQLQRFDGHEAAVMGADFSPDGKYAISASEDKTLRLWRLPP